MVLYEREISHLGQRGKAVKRTEIMLRETQTTKTTIQKQLNITAEKHRVNKLDPYSGACCHSGNLSVNRLLKAFQRSIYETANTYSNI